MAYKVIKYVNGKAYAYLQSSKREGKRVITESIYLGAVDGGASPEAGRTRRKKTGVESNKQSPHIEKGDLKNLQELKSKKPEIYERIAQLYGAAHDETNKQLYKYIGNADDKRSRIWRFSAVVFNYYNKHGSKQEIGIQSFGNRRNWAEECQRELAILGKKDGFSKYKEESKNGIRSARSALERVKNKKRIWGFYRARLIRQAEARLRLQELRRERIKILESVFV